MIGGELQHKIIDVDGVSYNIYIYIERRNSVRASITRKRIILRVPRQLRESDREEEIRKMLIWVVNKLRVEGLEKDIKKDYKDGDYIRTHYRIYKLEIEKRDSNKNFAKIKDNRAVIKIKNSLDEKSKQEYISKKLRKLLAKKHQKDLTEEVKKLNELHFGKELGPISYKYTHSRWGVCKSKTKEIQISTRLLLAPIEIKNYVIIHELAHLIEPNHSRRFWNIVKSVDHNYKEKIRWLKVHGKELVI